MILRACVSVRRCLRCWPTVNEIRHTTFSVQYTFSRHSNRMCRLDLLLVYWQFVAIIYANAVRALPTRNTSYLIFSSCECMKIISGPFCRLCVIRTKSGTTTPRVVRWYVRACFAAVAGGRREMERKQRRDRISRQMEWEANEKKTRMKFMECVWAREKETAPALICYVVVGVFIIVFGFVWNVENMYTYTFFFFAISFLHGHALTSSFALLSVAIHWNRQRLQQRWFAMRCEWTELSIFTVDRARVQATGSCGNLPALAGRERSSSFDAHIQLRAASFQLTKALPYPFLSLSLSLAECGFGALARSLIELFSH